MKWVRPPPYQTMSMDNETNLRWVPLYRVVFFLLEQEEEEEKNRFIDLV